MIIKTFDLNQINLNSNRYILFYGVNEGAKSEEISKIISKYKDKTTYKYDEKEVLENTDNIINNFLSKSLFENQKLLIINRASEKILKFISELIEREIPDIFVIINSTALDKRSKLRNLFEKDKNLICVPFYQDTNSTLTARVQKFLGEKNIKISQSDLNILIQKCNGDRGILNNELEKIEFYCKNKKTITTKELNKLINLIENTSVSELIDNCLAKNKKKAIQILNENIFNTDDNILILRTFLIKLKRILNIAEDYTKNNNLEKSIQNAKPPIFWKDKEIVKQQIKNWKPQQIREMIYEIGKIELDVKKYQNNSINFITDLIIQKATLN